MHDCLRVRLRAFTCTTLSAIANREEGPALARNPMCKAVIRFCLRLESVSADRVIIPRMGSLSLVPRWIDLPDTSTVTRSDEQFHRLGIGNQPSAWWNAGLFAFPHLQNNLRRRIGSSPAVWNLWRQSGGRSRGRMFARISKQKKGLAPGEEEQKDKTTT